MLRAARDQAGDALARAVGPMMRRVLRPLAARGRLRCPPLEGGRRLLLVQLDGLSRRRLERAVDAGDMPFLARRLQEGRLVLSSARSGAPASTPAFQAGLFYGVAPSVPGFVWYDRASGREIRMDRSTDAAAVEADLAARHPPLLRGGTSYFSIFSGGAALPHFCLSGRTGDVPLQALAEGFSGWDALASGLVHAVTAARTAGRAAWELGLGVWQGAVWSLTLGRLKHEPRFLVHRLLVGALFRELAVQGVVLDVARGVPAVYCDFLGFDEFAHRRGPDSPAAVAQLRSIDLALAALAAAVEAVPELCYDLYVLSDHGHVATRPFEALTGLSLPEHLALADGGVPVPARLPRGEAVRLAQTRALRAMLGRWPEPLRRPAAWALDRTERRLVGHALGFARADRVLTAEAGDLAHVYFADARRPQRLDEVRGHHPGALEALVTSRAVGLVAARGGARGVVLAAGRELWLDRPEDVARLPHPEPEVLAAYLADLVSLPDSGDLVVLGWRGEALPPVAYAWEFGSHGGVAPEELETFVLHPPACRLPFAAGLRPDALYRLFHDAYRAPERAARPGRLARPPGAAPARATP